MLRFARTAILAAPLLLGLSAHAQPQAAPPAVRFGNWLYKTPDAATWKKSEKDGAIMFDADLPPGDFCTLTLFPGAPAAPDFQKQFADAVDADQQRANGENFVSVSTGDGKWSTPVNVTNNAARKKFASTQTSSRSNVAVETSAYPGPAAAAFDRDGHLLLLMVNNEYSLFASTAFGVEIAGGDSSTPTLRFLRF